MHQAFNAKKIIIQVSEPVAYNKPVVIYFLIIALITPYALQWWANLFFYRSTINQ